MKQLQRRRQNLWIDTVDGFIGAAWYWPTHIAASPTAVVLVPGIAHEEQRMNGGLVALAEALANAGMPALLIDLHGCSQGAGRMDDPHIGASWRGDIRAAVRYARDCGAARVIVVGARLGVLLAADALAEEPLAAFVAWAPIASGRRYVRELKVMQRAVEPDVVAAGAISVAGFSIPSGVIEHVAGLDLTAIDLVRAERVLLRTSGEDQCLSWFNHLRASESLAEHQTSDRIAPWLFGAEDQPDLPHDDILALTRWCRTLHDERRPAVSGSGPRRPDQRRAIEFVHNGRMVRETFVEVGQNRMTGVLCEPAASPSGHAARLLMTTAGPGRMFTEFARDEAARGNSSLRFDFAGFGTSGRGDVAQGGEFYADCGASDVRAAIGFLRDAGHRRIYAFGFCAGAWAMLMANVAPELRAVAALNVALYREPGRDAPGLGRRTGRRLARISPLLARNPLLRGIAARVRRGESRRRQPVDWLMRLCDADVRVLLAYAEDDPGLAYLNTQMRKGVHARVRRPFALRTYAGLDHLAGGLSARLRLFSDITEFFADADREAASAQGRPSAPLPAAFGNQDRVSAGSR